MVPHLSKDKSELKKCDQYVVGIILFPHVDIDHETEWGRPLWVRREGGRKGGRERQIDKQTQRDRHSKFGESGGRNYKRVKQPTRQKETNPHHPPTHTERSVSVLAVCSFTYVLAAVPDRSVCANQSNRNQHNTDIFSFCFLLRLLLLFLLLLSSPSSFSSSFFCFSLLPLPSSSFFFCFFRVPCDGWDD